MITEEKKKVLELFAQGRRFYKLMKFQEARDEFAKALVIDANDGPSKKYHERCEEFIKNPPPEDWDGTYEMKTK
jgi:hypothetical protein